jgi:hypothetical protein
MRNDNDAVSTETQLATFFAKYEPGTAELGRALRARLRARLPGLFEIVYVYENQDSLVISYSPTQRGSDGVCGVALYPTCVKLFFGQGARLSKSDPGKLLEGRGKTVRHVVMNDVAELDRAPIERLLVAALALAKVRTDPAANGAVIVKADEQKQRARRTAKAKANAKAKAKAKGPVASTRTTKARR